MQLSFRHPCDQKVIDNPVIGNWQLKVMSLLDVSHQVSSKPKLVNLGLVLILVLVPVLVLVPLPVPLPVLVLLLLSHQVSSKTKLVNLGLVLPPVLGAVVCHVKHPFAKLTESLNNIRRSCQKESNSIVMNALPSVSKEACLAS